MKIVVLDSYTLNPGDLSWDALTELGDCSIYVRTPTDMILERSKDAAIILTNKTPLTAETIAQLTELKYIGLLSTGYDVVNVAAAKKHQIIATNIPAYGTQSVAQMVFAHILNLTQAVGLHAESVKEGKWAGSSDFCYWLRPLIELKDKTLGIVGYGKIGGEVAKIALAFGMNILACDPVRKEDTNVEFTDIQTVFKKSDFISLHCPLTQETNKFINKDIINLMHKSAYLINTGRGALIDEFDLADALNQDKIAGAGLDVLSKEPPLIDHPLLQAKNCFISPHIAWATLEARERLLKQAVENIKAFLAGHPVNIIQ
jgi:glycerate dehydrogenase